MPRFLLGSRVMKYTEAYISADFIGSGELDLIILFTK